LPSEKIKAVKNNRFTEILNKLRLKASFFINTNMVIDSFHVWIMGFFIVLFVAHLGFFGGGSGEGG
jgi:hypothetical protein